MKMSKSDKYTKRKFPMDRHTADYISPEDADSALVSAVGRQDPRVMHEQVVAQRYALDDVWGKSELLEHGENTREKTIIHNPITYN